MPRIQGRKWTPDELSLLRRLAYCAPLSTIVKALDRTVLAIRTKAAHERLPLEDDLQPRGAAHTNMPSSAEPPR